jgi:hypothetical protein
MAINFIPTKKAEVKSIHSKYGNAYNDFIQMKIEEACKTIKWLNKNQKEKYNARTNKRPATNK